MKMSAGGRLCTLQENLHFWVLTIKVRPPDGILVRLLDIPGLIARFMTEKDERAIKKRK
jgi:hypothetical protein